MTTTADAFRELVEQLQNEQAANEDAAEKLRYSTGQVLNTAVMLETAADHPPMIEAVQAVMADGLGGNACQIITRSNASMEAFIAALQGRIDAHGRFRRAIARIQERAKAP